MSYSEFSGLGSLSTPEFALGVVRGSRSFAVDELGRLTGVTFPVVWTPGENLAECKVAHDNQWKSNMRRAVAIANGSYKPNAFESLTIQLFGSINLFPAHPSYSSLFPNSLFSWMMESRGEVEKKIDMEPFMTLDHHAIKRAAEQYKEKLRIEKEKAAAELEEIIRLDTLEYCNHGFYAYYEGSNDYGDKQEYVNGVIEGYGEVVIGTRGFRAMKARIVALHIPKKIDANTAKLVRRNYPDVPFFDSFKKMLAEFPGDNGDGTKSPEDDPEFWTRKV